jgi:hypothetical protein
MTTSTSAHGKKSFDWKNLLFMMIGIVLFLIVFYSPPWPDAIDPMGKHFSLSQEAKGALPFFFWQVHFGFLKYCRSVLPVFLSEWCRLFFLSVRQAKPSKISWILRSCLFSVH